MKHEAHQQSQNSGHEGNSETNSQQGRTLTPPPFQLMATTSNPIQRTLTTLKAGTKVQAKRDRKSDYENAVIVSDNGAKSLGSLTYKVKFELDEKEMELGANYVKEGEKEEKFEMPKKKDVKENSEDDKKLFQSHESFSNFYMQQFPMVSAPLLNQGGMTKHGVFMEMAKSKGMEIEPKRKDPNVEKEKQQVGVSWKETHSFGGMGLGFSGMPLSFGIPLFQDAIEEDEEVNIQEEVQEKKEKPKKLKMVPFEEFATSTKGNKNDIYDKHDQFIFKNKSSNVGAERWEHQEESEFKKRKNFHSEANLVNSPQWKFMVDSLLQSFEFQLALWGDWTQLEEKEENDWDELDWMLVSQVLSGIENVLTVVINRSCCNTTKGSGHSGGCSNEMALVAQAFWKKVETRFGKKIAFLAQQGKSMRLEMSLGGKYDEGGVKNFEHLMESGWDLKAHEQFDFENQSKKPITQSQYKLLNMFTKAQENMDVMEEEGEDSKSVEDIILEDEHEEFN